MAVCAPMFAAIGRPVLASSPKRLCQEPGAGHGRGDECADVPMEQRAGRGLHQQVETVETADVRTGRDRAAETTIPGDGTLRDGWKTPHPHPTVKAGTKCPKTVGAKFPKNAGLKNPQPQLSSCIGAGGGK